MIDGSHLSALQTRLSHERGYLAAARSEKEAALRRVWIAQIEKEIAGEYRRLGITPSDDLPDMSDDELLAELLA